MSDPNDAHVDLAGYVLGRLNSDERARFEAHLEGCAECAAELADLHEVAELLPAAALAAPPAGLEARTLAAVRAAAAHDAAEAPPQATSRSRPGARRWGLRLATPVFAAVALLAGIVLGGGLTGDDPDGRLELTGLLSAPDGRSSAAVTVRETGIGRVVRLSSTDLPILPKGELYEVWFVGPDDRAPSLQRISAGTFHPDKAGRTEVTLAVAADPAKFPTISVTTEPGDGDPLPGREVLRWSRT